jgi:hypothetical protein
MKKIFTLGLGAIALAAAIGAQSAPLDVQTLSAGKVKNEDLRRFPFVVSPTEPRVAKGERRRTPQGACRG